MRPAHYLSLAAAVVLLIVLYFGVNTVPAPKASPATADNSSHNTPQMPGPSVEPASFDSLYAAAHKELPEHAAKEIGAVEAQIKAQRDSTKMIPLFDTVATMWKDHKQYPIAAWAISKAARLAHSEKRLTFAGQIFLDLAHREGQAPNVQLWEARQAVDCFSEALAINPANDTLKLALATSYIEGTHETMSGVGILRDIVAKRPDDIPANLMLGQLSIQSGQWDRAVGRYETVLKQDSNNREALYMLAEAYKGKGDKEKAIELFEKVKKVVNEPAFSKDVDNYINSFK